MRIEYGVAWFHDVERPECYGVLKLVVNTVPVSVSRSLLRHVHTGNTEHLDK